ncbi:Beta-galactosidase GanA [Paenibacillus sp. 1_12]|uniref:alpha-amylase family protein n=1 Tax=Paenibacillus sp. 1_12 TaxID=1566278 RepID=UPI0008E7783B|nr:family 10 glycosylhydrolase [Paenibacillus sp. 1_12]SFK99481.1 Beta-galactosidase GanA [Paenibacillus sp. 1_12]
MSKTDWFNKRGRGIHLTIRDIDCDNYDAEQMAKDFHEMHVSFFSFFAGGYVSTYPTNLDLQRESPYLNGKDVTGEIVEAAHRYGIKAVAMIDLGILPKKAALQNPHWCSVDGNGNLYESTDGFYVSCPLGGYQKDYAVQIVREIIEKYDVDGIKFGGASYGFKSSGICYCRNCRTDFKESTGLDLPTAKDRTSPVWTQFTRWKLKKTTACVKYLMDVVKSVDPDMPVFGNSVCFGDPEWTVGSSLDVEQMSNYQSAIQVEAQTRFKLDASGQAQWQSLRWTGEEARYMSSVTDKPIWVVVSYFMAWPWRRSAMTPVEQKVYLAQIAANGAMPMVNLSGGPPKVHEDPRGFIAMKELFEFHDKHNDYYDGDVSAANIAIIYSADTLNFYEPGNHDSHDHYVECIRGVEQSLLEAHIPFDIISTQTLSDEMLNKYKTVILPSMACMGEQEAEAIRRYSARGGGVIATGETSLFDLDGAKRNDFLLKDVFQAEYNGVTLQVNGKHTGEVMQAYMNIQDSTHPLVQGLEETSVVPIAYDYCTIKVSIDRTVVPLTLSAPFRVFPEGLSYTVEPDTGAAMAVLSENDTKGRTVYFPHRIDRLFWQTGIPDLKQLLVNAVLWSMHGEVPIVVSAPVTCEVSLRKKGNKIMVHLINLTGGRRVFNELVPLHGLSVGIKEPSVVKAYLLSTGESLEIRKSNDLSQVTVETLKDYDVVVFEV